MSGTTPTPELLRAIRASAGSGKTYELTSRYLSVLLRDGSADGMLATTFTRKAAGEILGRVLKRLAEAGSSEPAAAALAVDVGDPSLDAEGCRRMLRRLSATLHRVSISTLDSFFGRLFRSFPHEVGISGDAVLLAPDSPMALELRLEAIRLLLAEGEPAELLTLIDQLHGGKSQRSLVEALDTLVVDLYDTFRQAPEEAWRQLRVPEPPGEAALSASLAQLREYGEAHRLATWRKAIAADLEFARTGEWREMCTKGVMKAVLSGSGSFYKQPITPEVEQMYAPLRQQAEAELLGALARRTEATHQLLQRFDRHYAELRRRNRALLFSDIPFALLRIMDAHDAAELEYRTDARVAHLLLDEFQDTSPEQWAILKPFALETARASQSDAAGSFFCVGDVKQAIYGWRGGCAEIFDRLGQDIDGLAWGSRQSSWRSSRVVLDTVNQVFSTLAGNGALEKHPGASAAWARRFEPHTAQKQLPGYTELITSPTASGDLEAEEEDGTAPGAESHEGWAAGYIARLAKERPQASIGILVRKNDTVRRLLYHLTQLGIEASGEGGSAVVDDPAVEVILAALTLADHPGDSAAEFFLSSTPQAAALDLWRPGLGTAAEASLAIRRRLLTDGYAATVSDWAQRLAPLGNARGARRLTQLIELAEAFEPSAGLRPTEFVKYVLATAVEEPSPARVRVMSIHRSKGLEFDIVVLPELHGQIARMRPALLLDRPSPTAPIHAVSHYADTLLRTLQPDLERMHLRHLQAEVEESLCLLYVAMTRARFALHMVVPPLKPAANGGFKPPGFSHAAILREALAAGVPEDPAGQQTLFTAGDAGWKAPNPAVSHIAVEAAPRPARVTLAPAAGRRSWAEIAPSALGQGPRLTAASLLKPEDSAGRLFGTLTHAWLSSIRWIEDGVPPDSELLDIGSRAVHLDSADLAARLPFFHAMLARPAVCQALSRPAGAGPADVWCERPFAVHLPEGLVSGIFDRVVIRSESGRPAAAELIDYKTTAVTPETLSLVAEQSRAQVETYARALAILLQLPPSAVSARLLFVGSGLSYTIS